MDYLNLGLSYVLSQTMISATRLIVLVVDY